MSQLIRHDSSSLQWSFGLRLSELAAVDTQVGASGTFVLLKDGGMHDSPIYRTKRWREMRRQALARDGHRCRSCGSAGRLEVHHVRPIRDGGEPFEIANIMQLAAGLARDAMSASRTSSGPSVAHGVGSLRRGACGCLIGLSSSLRCCRWPGILIKLWSDVRQLKVWTSRHQAESDSIREDLAEIKVTLGWSPGVLTQPGGRGEAVTVGPINEPIIVQAPSITRGQRGGVLETWADLPGSPMYAYIEAPEGSSEEFVGQQLRYVRLRTASIRYHPDVTTKCRVVYDGQNWDILDVEPVGRRQFLTLTIASGLRE